MNRKLAIFAIVLLLGGAVAIAIISTRGRGSGKGAADEKTGSGAVSASTRGQGGGLAPGASKGGARRSREQRDAELVEKYGDARTGLSRHASENVVSLLEDAIGVGEMMTGAGGFGGQMALGGLLRGTEIELTDEQRKKALELHREFRARELEKRRETVDALKKDPLPLMELFLAGDAKQRGEMSEEEYAQVQQQAAERLMGVINPLEHENFQGPQAWEDEAFRSGFEAILDADQTEKWDASIAEKEAKREEAAGNAGDEGGRDKTNITSLPTMELETLDQAIGSAKQMTSGFKQLMEGMGSLRDLQPKIEGQPEGGGGSEPPADGGR